jgi:hypothetical protein
MILLLAGVALLLLGLFCGAVLVAIPLGLAAGSPGLVLWILFPLFTVAGYVLAVIGGRDSQFRGLSMAISCALLLLALGAAGGLVMDAAGMMSTAAGGTLSLWYVLAVAGVVGVVGAAAAGVRTESAHA